MKGRIVTFRKFHIKIRIGVWSLILVLICLLTIYAPIELTWLIISGAFVSNFWPETPHWLFGLEIVFIWLFYIAAMFLAWRFCKYHI